MLWIKNTDGKPDAVLTMATLGFITCILKVLLAGAALTLGAKTFAAGTIDGGIIAAILTPTLGAYVARRYTDASKK
jgi:hypothetical protein